jgi:mRNA interferase RelE/StbE
LFQVAETDEFRKRLSSLPEPERQRIQRKLIDSVYPLLRANPFSGPNIKRLTNYHPPTWRYRIGPYRVFYEIKPTVVFLTTIERRRDAYR